MQYGKEVNMPDIKLEPIDLNGVRMAIRERAVTYLIEKDRPAYISMSIQDDKDPARVFQLEMRIGITDTLDQQLAIAINGEVIYKELASDVDRDFFLEIKEVAKAWMQDILDKSHEDTTLYWHNIREYKKEPVDLAKIPARKFLLECGIDQVSGGKLFLKMLGVSSVHGMDPDDVDKRCTAQQIRALKVQHVIQIVGLDGWMKLKLQMERLGHYYTEEELGNVGQG